MGWFSNILNPVKYTKNVLKATAKGDIGRVLDPGKIISKETPIEKESAKSRLTEVLAGTPTNRGPYMGARGNTIFLGGNSGGRQYTPNPFGTMPSAAPPQMAPQIPSAAPPTGVAPTMGVAPPPQVQGKMSIQGGPQSPGLQNHMISMLRGRGKVL